METLQDLGVVFGRIITIIPLLLVIALYMGKRSIGELPVFDFLIIATLANITGADIADPEVDHIHTAFAIVVVAFMQKLISKALIKKRKFGKLISFEPTMVIKDGQLLVKNLKNIQFSIDNILQMLRQKDIFDMKDVEVAIIEANGKLSVYKKSAKSTVTIEDLSISKKSGGIAYPIIINGVIDEKMLAQFKVSKEWLFQELQTKGITRIDRVFYASINKQKELHFSLVDANPNIPSIHH